MGLFTQSAYITTSSLNSFYNESRGINVLPNGSIEFFSRDANSMLKYVITGPYQQNIWHQIVLVQNQSLVYGYIDSIMVLELNMGSYLTSYDNFFTIGRGTNTTDFFQGNVDDVRVYTTALTNTNVTALYKQSSLPVPTVNNTQNPPTNNSSITNTLTLSSPGFTITSILITGGICTIGIVIWKEKRRK